MKRTYISSPLEREIVRHNNGLSVVYFRENVIQKARRYVAQEYSFCFKSKEDLIADIEYVEQNAVSFLARAKAREIRIRREKECFAFTDRAAWFFSLTDEQRDAVMIWRQAWLDAPETLIIPSKPDFVR